VREEFDSSGGPEGRQYLTSEYLGIRYSNNLVLLQITLNQGSDSGAEKAFGSKSPWGTGRSEMINCPAQFAAVCLETLSSLSTSGRRGVQSSHRPFGLAGPLNISHVPQAVASTAAVKYWHPLQVLLGSGDFSV
jgi:hypothetical protein